MSIQAGWSLLFQHSFFRFKRQLNQPSKHLSFFAPHRVNYEFYTSRSWILDPTSSPVLRWNLLLQLFGHLFTAVYTPFEVALLPTDAGAGDPRFWVNRVIDLVFLVDMAVDLNTPYRRADNRFEKRRAKITERYLESWFLLDLLAIFPFEALDAGEFRILRCLRLLRIVKISKASKHLDELQARFVTSYLHLQLFKFISIFLLTTHWMACAWCFVATNAKPTWGLSEREATKRGLDPEDDSDKTWIDALAMSKLTGDIYTDHGLFETYAAALHFAVMTVTSVGYGDITPQNRVEYVVSVILIASGCIT